MIFENKHMKYDNPKGRRQGETKMTPHVGRSKSTPPFAGSQKSMFDEQFVKNCKQKKNTDHFGKMYFHSMGHSLQSNEI
jgi:hypothetical protein